MTGIKSPERIGVALVVLWLMCAAVVAAVHGGIAALAIAWSEEEPTGGTPAAILVELAPMDAQAGARQTDLPVGPPQPDQIGDALKPEPDQPDRKEPESEQDRKPEEPEKKIVDVPPEPPVPAEITLPTETAKPPPKPRQVASTAAAPERAERVAPRRSANATGIASINPNAFASYAASVIRPHVMRHYGYPASANGRAGVVVVNFTITRQGRLVSRSIAKSSGHAELDSAALATIQRAQPFPPAPPGLNDPQFSFSLPMRYNAAR